MNESKKTDIKDVGEKAKNAVGQFVNKDFGKFKGLHIVCAAGYRLLNNSMWRK